MTARKGENKCIEEEEGPAGSRSKQLEQAECTSRVSAFGGRNKGKRSEEGPRYECISVYFTTEIKEVLLDEQSLNL